MAINIVGELKGTIIAPARFIGQIEQTNTLKGTIDASYDKAYIGQLKAVITDTTNLVGKITGVNNLKGIVSLSEPVELYQGDYIITPKIRSQNMNTKNKKMEENVTVLAIPYYETSNLTGKTVYIGGNYGE